MKSALISGSKKPNYTNRVYAEETGFGIPQFLDVDQAVKNLYIILTQLRKTGLMIETNIRYISKKVKKLEQILLD